MAFSCVAGSLQTPVQVGTVLKMTNSNVRLEYDLGTGRADFYWQHALKIKGFYAGVDLTPYITGTVYSNRTWTVNGNVVEIALTKPGLPLMKQTFILEQDNSFLTRVEVSGNGLATRWSGPVVVDTAGWVDIGTSNDNRALIVPFDNDSFTFSYNAMPLNNTSLSYEVCAFYDNTTRHGLVVGSVSHDTWKTGIYFQGANNKLRLMNVFGGVTSANTRDVIEHGLVKGGTLVSPTVFVGFGADWRDTMEDYAEANAANVPRLAWNGGVPFGWNSWYCYGTGLSYSNAAAAANFIKSRLQTNHFHNRGVVYVNLDSFWDNLTDAQVTQFASLCHSNGQKAGIYWTPFVFWGTAEQGTNWHMSGTASYNWANAYLRTPDGSPQVIDGGIALDPTHPGFRQMAAYYFNYFKSRGYDYLKLDFLTHGALEGVHYDTNVFTGIQAFNQGMQYLVAQNNGRMFLSESIAPIFPYQYAHSRRIYCDAATFIGDTEATMQAVTYGWWINSRLYQFSDPDVMKFAGGTANENQSRLINCAVAGTVFLNSDDLASEGGQNLAEAYLTNPSMNELARAGVSFRPVEGNTGTSAADGFVRQDGSTWYVALFNYSSSNVTRYLSLARLGISGVYTAMDLWSGALSAVNGTTWTVTLGPRQAKLFRLGTGNTSATGPANQELVPGSSTTLTTVASGTPPFSYVWRKNGIELNGQTVNTITLNPVGVGDAGTYSVEVTGGTGSVTNTATLTLFAPPTLNANITGATFVVRWPTGHTGWRLETRTNDLLGTGPWWVLPGSMQTNLWAIPLDGEVPGACFRLVYP